MGSLPAIISPSPTLQRPQRWGLGLGLGSGPALLNQHPSSSSTSRRSKSAMALPLPLSASSASARRIGSSTGERAPMGRHGGGTSARGSAGFGSPSLISLLPLLLLLLPSLPSICVAYRPGDIVPVARMGQYHSVRSLGTLLSLEIVLEIVLCSLSADEFPFAFCVVFFFLMFDSFASFFFFGDSSVQVTVARRDRSPLPCVRRQSRGDCPPSSSLLLRGCASRAFPFAIVTFAVSSVLEQVLVPIPRPEGFTNADPYKV